MSRESAPMLTDEQRAEGWIEHGGGPCPLPLVSRILVRVRGGEVTPFRADAVIWEYGSMIWEINSPMPRDCEVIAYKLESPDV